MKKWILFYLLTVCSVTADVVINEFMARNRGAHINASGDDRADWIELHNNGALPEDLTGWHLTDDPYNLAKWAFPTTIIPSGGYLLIYADNASTSIISGELHADFALRTEGEYLALVAADSNTVVDAVTTYEVSPGQYGYPPQSENISYGRNAGNGYSFFENATPGAVNGTGASDFVADTRFSHDRGFYTEPFELVIGSSTPGAEIYFTTNGSSPEVTSTLYTGPIAISATTCVRARAFKNGLYPTDVDTHTYLFIEDVVRQSEDPPSAEWPNFNVNGQVMQYGMDPDITHHVDYTNKIDDALLSLPTISLVTDLDNLFDSSVGIYVNANREGDLWERETSVELLNPDGSIGFQEDSGLRIRGGASRNAAVPKHGFRLRFRRDYGAAKLQFPIFGEDGPDASNGVDLRCSQTPGWHYFTSGRAVYARDIFARDLQIAQGQPSTRGDKYHLYLNGAYWGIYETQENIEPPFMAENWGGDDEDYDIIGKKKHGHTLDGSDAAYRDLFDITMAGFDGTAGMTNYYYAQGFDTDGLTRNSSYVRLLDVEALTDYMLVHYWTGELDGMAGNWGLNNYLCAFNRENPDGFKFFKYDSEWSLDEGFANNVTRTDSSTDFNRFNALVIHGKLVQNPEYLIAFADQAHKHFFNDGVMTADNALALFTKRTDEIDTAIIAESARWGDGKDANAPRTRNDHWVPDVNITRNWITGRTATVLTQLRNAGWYPDLDAPVFNQHGGAFSAGFNLTITGPGTVYYTMDGTDPREILTGTARGTVYSGPVPLTHGAVVKARSMTSTNDWSALNEAVFVADVENTLRISEVMYNPRRPVGVETNHGAARADFEFVEIHNEGPNEIGLAGIELKAHLGDGVSFDFTGSAVLSVPANGYVLVVGNLEAFASRYNTNNLLIAGVFDGNLDDGGDTIELITSQGEVLADFVYGDGRDWPLTADGAGHSLVPLVSSNQTAEAMEFGGNWRASTYLDGSPGAVDPAEVTSVRLNEVESHTDYSNPTPPFDQYDSNDGIELFNTTAGTISLGDWYLSDDADDLRKWPIPAGTMMNGNDWHWFSEVNDFHNPITSGFGISKAGETIYLSHLPGTTADRVADAVELKGLANGTSWGRIPDGAGYWQTCMPTTNAANARVATSVVINEVMYHPAGDGDLEYVELCNVSESPVDLFNDGLTWRLNDGIDFSFPTNATLMPGQCVAVVPFDPEDPLQIEEQTAFFAAYRQYAGETWLVGPYSGRLANDDDRIAVEKPQAPDGVGDPPSWIMVDEMTYAVRAPWPTTSNGTGLPLQRGDHTAAGNDPLAWYTSGFASPGFPDAVVELLSPPSGSTLLIPQLAELTIAVDTQRLTGAISEVSFLLDGGNLSTDTSAPYQHTLSLSDINTPGLYNLRARLRDASGDRFSRTIPVNVEFADRVTIVQPDGDLDVIPPYTLEVIAEVEHELVIGGVNNVEFFLDGNSLGVDYSAPYSWAIDQPVISGTYALTAVMTDSLVSSTSPVVNVTVHTDPPVVDLSGVPDHTVLIDNGTTLDAQLDLNGLPPELVMVEWSQASGPGTVIFDDENEASTTATFTGAGVYEVVLTVRYGAYEVTYSRMVNVEGGNAENTVRYAEPFESYLPGTILSGFNGWFGPGGDTSPMIISTNVMLANPGAVPIPYASHDQALAIDGMITNAFVAMGAYTSLWIDSVCEMARWRNPSPPEHRDSAQLQMYVDVDGYLQVWNTPDPVNHPVSNGWTAIPGLQVDDGAYHRITVHADYQREASGHFYFELFVDGVQITQPVARFAAANTNNAFLSRLVMSGPFVLDDLVVDVRDPFTALYLIRADAGQNGSISPSANVFVEAGGSHQFTITPDQFFHIADVLVDQVSVGSVSSVPFNNVMNNHQIEAVFAPDMAANNTPHWWLHQQNPAWAADFDAAALGNNDGDPLLNWQEYRAGTDPQNEYSYPWLTVSNRSAHVRSLEFPAAENRRYRLQRKIGGLDGIWVDVELGMPGTPEQNGLMTVERTNTFDRVYYRVGVEMP